MKFSTHDLEYAIASLSNLIGAGVMTVDALREMQEIQPKYAVFWKTASKLAENGESLSESLRPILDVPTYSAITAAENSGTLTEVFSELVIAMQEKRAIRKTLLTMVYPFAMFIAAASVFTMFLGFVTPTLAKSMPYNDGQKSMLNTVADALHEFLVTYNWHLAIGITAAVAFFIYWLRDPNNRNTIVSILDKTPLIGAAIRDLIYGEWANHMSINTHAGITVLDAIQLTYKMMPAYYHPELLAVANDITRIGLAAASSKKQNNDPRNRIPFLIVNAFRFSEKTGVSDTHFKNAATALITQGKQRVNVFVSMATNIIIPITAILGASAILPYFMQIGDSFAKMQ